MRKEHAHGEHAARCGRCAHILPDETLTFCPKCGIPFSKVHPTTSYATLAEHNHTLLIQGYRRRLVFTTTSIFAAFWLLLGSFSSLQNESMLRELHAVRPLEVFLIEDSSYPSIDVQTQMESIAVAVQSFEEHFDIKISDVIVRRNQLPQIIEEKFPDLWTNPQRSSLSYWESQIFPKLNPTWNEVATKPLPVIFTNVPIVNDLGSDAPLETAHLNAWGLVSGLGHPSLTVVSSYRMLREEEALLGKHAAPGSPTRRHLQARFLGEYVFAHELGHALLSLPDFVHSFRQPARVALRGPASVNSDNPDYARCLMHTDQGGGYRAWGAIRERQEKGEAASRKDASSCPEYNEVIAAYKLRIQAIGALKNGDRDEAEKIYKEMLQVYNPSTKSWLRHQWEQEEQLFLSFIRRWWSGFFLHG